MREVSKEFLDRIRPYIAPKNAAKKDTENPCRYCGWANHAAIHNNPKLNGRGPYHDYVAPQA